MGKLIRPRLLPAATTNQICLLNGILYPMPVVRSVAARMCTNLVRWHPQLSENELQLLGSSIGIRYRGRHVVLATRHQLIKLGIAEGAVTELGQLLLCASKVVTSSGFFQIRTIEEYTEDDRYDIIALFYDDPAEIYPELKGRFFEISTGWDPIPEEILKCFAIGCAFCDQVVDLFDKRHLHVARRNHECAFLGPTETPDVYRVKDLSEDSFDPNGMSGGAVLFIRDHIYCPKVELGGLIQRAGNSYYRYLSAAQILRFLDAAIESYDRAALPERKASP